MRSEERERSKKRGRNEREVEEQEKENEGFWQKLKRMLDEGEREKLDMEFEENLKVGKSEILKITV